MGLTSQSRRHATIGTLFNNVCRLLLVLNWQRYLLSCFLVSEYHTYWKYAIAWYRDISVLNIVYTFITAWWKLSIGVLSPPRIWYQSFFIKFKFMLYSFNLEFFKYNVEMWDWDRGSGIPLKKGPENGLSVVDHFPKFCEEQSALIEYAGDVWMVRPCFVGYIVHFSSRSTYVRSHLLLLWSTRWGPIFDWF